MTIAVVVPVFNGARHLGEALRSVEAQRRRPDEVLIVDDGSADDSPRIAAAWNPGFPVRLLRNRFAADAGAGRGPAGGRMTGLLAARADLVALLDQDDAFLPGHLQATERAFAAHPGLALCFGDATEFDGTRERSLFAGKRIEGLACRESGDGLRTIDGGGFWDSLAIEGSYVPTAANLWRREMGIRAGGFDARAGTCDDLLFFMRLSRLGAVAYYPFEIARKRKHDANLSDPRFALSLAWNAREALRLVSMDDPSPLLERRMRELHGEILYHASRRGIGSYWDARRRLGGGLLDARGLGRAVAASARAVALG